MLIILLIAVVVVLVLVILKFVKAFRIPNDRNILFTGGLGSGKTMFGVKHLFRLRAHKLLQLKLKALKFKLMFWKHKKFLYEKPLIYSSIPLRSKYYRRLTVEMILRKELMTENCIIFFDEFGGIFADQYSWNNPYVIELVTSFVRFARHWLDASIVFTDQTSESIVKPVRDRISCEIHLSNWRKWFHFWCIADVVPVQHITSDCTNVILPDQDHPKYVIMRLPCHPVYDTRCYKPSYHNGFVFDIKDDVCLGALTTRYMYDIDPPKEIEEQYKKNRKAVRRELFSAPLPPN